VRKISGTTVALAALALTALTAIIGFSAANGAAMERMEQQERRIDRLEISIAGQMSSIQTDVREIRQFLIGERRIVQWGKDEEGQRN